MDAHSIEKIFEKKPLVVSPMQSHEYAYFNKYLHKLRRPGYKPSESCHKQQLPRLRKHNNYKHNGSPLAEQARNLQQKLTGGNERGESKIESTLNHSVVEQCLSDTVLLPQNLETPGSPSTPGEADNINFYVKVVERQCNSQNSPKERSNSVQKSLPLLRSQVSNTSDQPIMSSFQELSTLYSGQRQFWEQYDRMYQLFDEEPRKYPMPIPTNGSNLLMHFLTKLSCHTSQFTVDQLNVAFK